MTRCIVGKRKWQYQTGREAAAVPHGTDRGTADAQDRDLRGVDDRRERRSADAAQARDCKGRTGHVGRSELALARLSGEFRRLACDREDAFRIGTAKHGNDESVRRVCGEADIIILFADEGIAGEGTVDVGMRDERRHDRLHDEREHRHFGRAGSPRSAPYEALRVR